jgi:tape measure domain-containing protein
MADDTTRLIISIETLLKGVDKTLAGLSQVEKRLKSVGTAISTGATDKSIARNLAAQQRTVEALQRQRSAALIAEERKRIAAVESLQAKRSAALIAQEKKQQADIQTVQRRAAAQQLIESQRQQAAVNSLQRQRSAALIAQARQAEQLAARQAKASFAALPQADAHVQAFRKIEAANTAAAASANALNARLQSLGNGLRSLGQGAASIGIGLTVALTVPLVAFGKAGLDAAVTIDSLRRGLIAIVGSSAEAEVQLKRLTEIAKLPGIGFEEAIQGSIRLQAVGFSAKDAEKALIEFSNAIALTGGGREELSRVTVQLGQLAAKGKVLSQDLRPIIEAAPAVGRALKAAFGTVNADDIANLTTNSREFLDVLTKELEKLPRVAGGAKNAFENFRDTIFRASAAIGDALIPVLSNLIDVIGPAVTQLAQSFRELPTPIQTTLVAIGAFAAVLGPTLFIFGQFTTGIGRTIVSLAQLNALGLLPTIANFRLLGQVMAGTASIAGSAGLSTLIAAAPWLALAVGVVAATVAFDAWLHKKREIIKVDVEAAKARNARLASVDTEVKFLQDLQSKVSLTADQQKRLEQAYGSLTGAAKVRVNGIEDETEKLNALIAAKKEQAKIDAFAARATQAALVENVVTALEKQTKAQNDLNGAKERTLTSAAFRRSIESLDITEQQTRLTEFQNKAAIQAEAAQGDLSRAELETGKAIKVLSEVTGVSVKSLFEQLKAAGKTEAEITQLQKAIDALAKSEQDGLGAVDDFTKALNDQLNELLKLGKAAQDAETRRKTIISGAAAEAREVSDSFEGATKWMKAFIAANPEIGEAVKKELQLQGKSLDEFLEDTLGKRDKRGGALRNAQEQLAKAIAAAALSSAEQENQIEHTKNERLLQENEHAFKLQLISYRQYLNQRAFLTSSNIELEIREQERIATNALAQQQRFADRAARAGIPAPERVKAKAGAVEAEKIVIEANTKILALRAKQKADITEIDQLLAESQRQQIKDIRQLEIEYATLRGRIEDALNAATDEKFRESLLQLGLAQDDLNKRFQLAKEAKDADKQAEISLAQAINQRHIDAINGIVDEERATNKLTVAQEFISQAKQRQADLEKQIAFDVDFRGLKEEEAIRRRLEGEEKVRNSLKIAKDIIQETIARLEQLGLTPPKGLIDFVNDVTLAMKGLGELSFAEQFRLAQQEFDRLNDERIVKIQDVERAVRHRDLAEIEGRILIKKLNGEYVADLERQAEVLRQIAEKSGQQGLLKQATDAQQAAKDIRAATDEVADFNIALRSTTIDALREGFSQFFKDLTDNTKSAKEKLLSLLDSVRNRINDFIAERLADKLIESLFGTGKKGEEGLLGGIFNKVLGIEPGADTATAANTTATDANTEAINGLTTAFGGQVAGGIGGLFGGGGGAGGTVGQVAGIADSILGSLGISVPGLGETAQKGSTVIEALNIVSDWLSKLSTAVKDLTDAVNQNTQAQGGSSLQQGITALFGGGGGEATGDIIPAAPKGRIIRVAEAGFDEAVLTTDPKHALRQARILHEFLSRTHGLMGRFRAVPEFAEGGLLSARDAEANMLHSIAAGRVGSPSLPDSVVAGGGNQVTPINFRNINLFDRRRLVGDHIRSAEGARDIMNIISENSDEIGRRIGVK